MADAQDSKSCGGDLVWVQVPPSALNEIPEMLKIPVFPGFPFTDRKKRGHKRGKFIKV